MRILPHNKTDFEDTSTLFFPHAIKAVKKSMDVKIHKLHSVYNCIYSKNPDLRNQARKALSFASDAKKLPKL